MRLEFGELLGEIGLDGTSKNKRQRRRSVGEGGRLDCPLVRIVYSMQDGIAWLHVHSRRAMRRLEHSWAEVSPTPNAGGSMNWHSRRRERGGLELATHDRSPPA